MSTGLVCCTFLGQIYTLSPDALSAFLLLDRPNNDVRLATIKESPVLQRTGFTENVFEKGGNYVPTMEGKYSVYTSFAFSH